MKTQVKMLVANKIWILKEQGQKLGTLSKEKKGYAFFKKGTRIPFKDLSAVKQKFGADLFSNISDDFSLKNKTKNDKIIYDYLCSSHPFNPIYNVKKKLPIFAKSSKSKSLYCAGYYVIKFRKRWVSSFCPKLITLDRYAYFGPYKTETEMKVVLNQINKNETT
jgi:hypothetical protein